MEAADWRCQDSSIEILKVGIENHSLISTSVQRYLEGWLENVQNVHIKRIKSNPIHNFSWGPLIIMQNNNGEVFIAPLLHLFQQRFRCGFVQRSFEKQMPNFIRVHPLSPHICSTSPRDVYIERPQEGASDLYQEDRPRLTAVRGCH